MRLRCNSNFSSELSLIYPLTTSLFQTSLALPQISSAWLFIMAEGMGISYSSVEPFDVVTVQLSLAA